MNLCVAALRKSKSAVKSIRAITYPSIELTYDAKNDVFTELYYDCAVPLLPMQRRPTNHEQ